MNITPAWVRALPYVVGAAAVVAGLTLAYQHGHQVSDDHWQRVIEQTNADNAREQVRLEAAARLDEQNKAGTLHAIDQQHIQDKQNEITSRDRTIADLNSGAVGLRKRFACPAATDEHLPSAATSTGQRDAASEGGLQRADAEFLIRFASAADQAVMQLQACQAVVQADRSGRSEP